MTRISPKITPEAFQALGAKIASNGTRTQIDDASYVAFYGTSPEIVSECWNQMSKPDGARAMHLLWTLMFLKLYVPEDAMCIMVNTCCCVDFTK